MSFYLLLFFNLHFNSLWNPWHCDQFCDQGYSYTHWLGHPKTKPKTMTIKLHAPIIKKKRRKENFVLLYITIICILHIY